MVKRYRRTRRAVGPNHKTSKREVRKMIQSTIDKETEKKFNDAAVQNVPITPAGIGLQPFAMTQGVETFQRIANKIRVTDIDWRLFVYGNGTSTLPVGVRIVLILDKQPNGSLPSNSDMFLVNTSSLIPYVPWNPNTVPSRFRILYDKTHILTMDGGSTNVAPGHFIHIKKKVNILTQYNNLNNGNVGDVSTNYVFGLVLSDQSSGASVPFLTSVLLGRFEDP